MGMDRRIERLENHPPDRRGIETLTDGELYVIMAQALGVEPHELTEELIDGLIAAAAKESE